MAEPKITSVDISRLQECNPDLMEGLQRPQLQQKLREVLTGSDLKIDEKTGEIVLSDKAQKLTDTADQAIKVRGYLEAAGEGDNTITLEEAKAFMAKHSEDFRGITPEGFLQDAQDFIDKRWATICKNLKRYSLEFPMENLMANLSLYNKGVYKEEFDQARYSFSPVKSAINAPTWLGNMATLGYFTSPIKGWDLEGDRETTYQPTFLGGDNLSMQDAYDDHLLREGAIQALITVINQDVTTHGDKSISWKIMSAKTELENPTESAESLLQLLEKTDEIKVTVQCRGIGADELNPNLQKYEMTIKGPEAAEMLRDNLDFPGLFDLFMTKDKDKRYDKAIAYALAERPNALGFGGGNSKHRDKLDNLITAEVNNFYYAKTLLLTVMREGNPEQQAQAKIILETQIAPSSQKITQDMTEEPGGFLLDKFVYYGAETLSTIFTARTWHPIPYRAMPDEEAMYAPERVFKGLAFFVGSPHIFRGSSAAGSWISGKTSPTFNTWRAAKFSEQAGVLRKGAWFMQRPPLAAVWVGDKLSLGPLRRMWQKKAEASASAGKINKTVNVLGAYAARGLATYVFDDYVSPTISEDYGPNLNTTLVARRHTLNPLPPTSKFDPPPGAKKKE